MAGRLEGISAYLGDGIAVVLSTHTGEVTFIPSDIPAQEALRRAVSALYEAIDRDVRAMHLSEATNARHTQDFTLMNELVAAQREDRGAVARLPA